MNTREVVEITVFKDFKIVFRGQVYQVGNYLSKQLINLLQFFVMNYDKDISREKLCEELWSESANPRSALKFTIHRLRNSLKDMIKEDIDWIETTQAGYRLNNHFEYRLDMAEFYDIYKQLEQKDSFQKKDYDLAMRMMDVYSGHLYMTSSELPYMQQIGQWYCNAFVQIAGKICQYLIRIADYEKMIQVDYLAILKEPFYEGLHYFYMQGLIAKGEYHQAIQYFHSTNETFYKELGTGLSPRFKDLYNVIVDEYEEEKTLRLKDIKKQLNVMIEKEDVSRGYYCTFDLFKHIYNLCLKTSQRDGKEYFLILFETQLENALYKKTKISNRLRNIILECIRKSDICAKINDSQFILLVNCHEKEETQIIIDRIINAFYKQYSQEEYPIVYHVDHMKSFRKI